MIDATVFEIPGKLAAFKLADIAGALRLIGALVAAVREAEILEGAPDT